ncbi:hypothetical protein G4G27_16580 [Sphingomonas sp. So64.6b]|uniref:hypothetical protein n=1 Tax=Sphingomonas sp. So64.6b TaxID=2997354 RepID=UPI0015FFDDBE|nr:hypothetical protein [Sphingomonas sp. So64.6b]QNA85429.1 hypothetical protein G4G27_16580 [Sphingomonas sp. So64.6b]
MFGFGKKRQTKTAKIYELTFFPDGAVIENQWFDADAGTLRRPGQGKVVQELRIGESACRLDATLRNGDAIFSMWSDDRIVTSSLFLSSSDAALNDQLTGLYLDSIRQTDLVRQLTQGMDAPFQEVSRAAERPLLVTLLMPAPSAELTDTLIEYQRQWVSALIA